MRRNITQAPQLSKLLEQSVKHSTAYKNKTKVHPPAEKFKVSSHMISSTDEGLGCNYPTNKHHLTSSRNPDLRNIIKPAPSQALVLQDPDSNKCTNPATSKSTHLVQPSQYNCKYNNPPLLAAFTAPQIIKTSPGINYWYSS